MLDLSSAGQGRGEQKLPLGPGVSVSDLARPVGIIIAFVAIVFPIQGLEVVQIVLTALCDGSDMIHLPTIKSGRAMCHSGDRLSTTVSAIGTRVIARDGAALLPNRLHHLDGERTTRFVRARISGRYHNGFSLAPPRPNQRRCLIVAGSDTMLFDGSMSG